eukprot:Blabericola_migrator_1__1200@NODE_1307_length_4844_cov_159_193427_g879_i0_p2_GENE_NODE_1307_length_4844_cov_159_193427_g879_i0NODE_1307_length_4844_cov_159_193427_g879_i0_p2_ORF_typecomplete_len312_score12_61Asp/PF00026_23/1_6e29TAXi_N/PF14543_6/0_0013_NODE_1307_length_4844_cov_159_193427_g879_i02941229
MCVYVFSDSYVSMYLRVSSAYGILLLTARCFPYRFTQARSRSLLPLTMKSHLHTFVNSYSAEVLFGTGTEQFAVPVMFDTGSSENWVISTECHDSDCEGHRKYSRTSTFVADPENRTLVTRFLSGSITSHLGRDTMNLGDGVVVPGGTFNLVTHMDVPVLKSLGWDGIIGLAFTSPEQRRQGRRSLIDHIKAELLTSLGRRNQFGYFVSPLGGMITFGGTSSAIAPIGDITWIPVNTSLSYWGLDVSGHCCFLCDCGIRSGVSRWTAGEQRCIMANLYWTQALSSLTLLHVRGIDLRNTIVVQIYSDLINH